MISAHSGGATWRDVEQCFNNKANNDSEGGILHGGGRVKLLTHFSAQMVYCSRVEEKWKGAMQIEVGH